MKCPNCKTSNITEAKFCRECASPLVASRGIQIPFTQTFAGSPADLNLGSVFAGRYQIIEELGRGGMGKVYKAFDREIEEHIAIKLIHPNIAMEENATQRFRNELKFARKISHKNVCRMFDLSKEDNRYFITMEYVKGEDLKNSMNRMGPLSFGKAVFIVKQICEGLAEAHRLGVVHRDLKPQNIMIDTDGNVRLMDFGISRLLKTKGITHTGTMIGSPEYMSPEQTMAKEADQRSDIYSLGIIFYEMITGRVPFEGDTAMSIAWKHTHEAPVSPKEHNHQIPNNLNDAIMKCLEKNRQHRYQNTQDLIEALTEIENGIPSTERVLPKAVTSKEITIKIPQIMLAKSLLILAAIIGLGIAGWLIIPGFRAPAPSPVQEIQASVDTWIQEGVQLQENGEYKDALGTFQQVLAEDPDNYEALYRVVDCLKRLDRFEEAVLEGQKAVMLDEQNPRGYELLGSIYEQQDELEKAEILYTQYLDLMPPGNTNTKFEQRIKSIQNRRARAEGKSAKPPVSSTRPVPEPGKPKQKKPDIPALLKSALTSFESRKFAQSQQLLEHVLSIDPHNENAVKYLGLVETEIATAAIQHMLDTYITELGQGRLVNFYKNSCTQEFFKEIKTNAELLSQTYEKIAAFGSQLQVGLTDSETAQAVFNHILTGVSKRDRQKQVLFEGQYQWELKKLENTWKINGISSRSSEKIHQPK